MDGAAAVLLASVVGVSFGWQPMPDESQRYEYVVHVSPELADDLAAGQSIPIVSDVPEDIRPVARVRIVVDRGDAPRRQLATRLKPVIEAVHDGDIVLTQYTQPSTPGFPQPAGGYPAPADPRYGTSASSATQPTGAATTGTTSGSSSWNGGAPATSAAPSATQLFGNGAVAPVSAADPYAPRGTTATGQPTTVGSTWNGGSAVDSATQQATAIGNQIQAGAQQAADSVRRSYEQADSSVKAAANNLGKQTQQMLDDLGRPLQPRDPSTLDARSAATATGQPTTVGSTWNGGSATPGVSATSGTGVGNSWNGGGTTAPPYGTPAAASSAPASSTSGNAARRLDQSINPQDVGRWNNGSATGNAASPAVGRSTPATQPIAHWPSTADERSSAASSATSGSARGGEGWPAPSSGSGFGSSATGSSTAANDGPVFPGAGNDLRSGTAGFGQASSTGLPALDARMLSQPAGRPLDGPTSPVAAATAGATSTGAAVGTSSTSPLGTTPTGTASTNGFPFASQPVTATAGNGRSAMVALAAWVLLTGSAAGNMYLFWSYVDVRNKYRVLVRRMARAV